MSADIVWQPLRDELRRWADAGRTVDLWFRDDDAVQPTDALDRLLTLSGRFAVPVTLAVIPAFTGEALAARLAGEPGISVAVHGWSHENHAPPSQKKQELGPHRPLSAVLGELLQGFLKLRTLHPERFVPILVPPWNRVASDLLPQLPALGYTALSVFGTAKPAPVTLINTHVDIMDWHGTGGCRPHADLVRDLVSQLTGRFAGSAEPVGILTHHLVHDGAAWDFIAMLFEEVAGSSAVRWRRVEDFLS